MFHGAQAGLELAMLPPPKCDRWSHVPPFLASLILSNMLCGSDFVGVTGEQES